VSGRADTAGDRVLTIPNALSMARILGVPLFLWLILGPHRDGLALLVLMLSGATDYFDGWLARRWNAQSPWGAMLDPIAGSPDQFAEFIKAEAAKWSKVVKDANLKVE